METVLDNPNLVEQLCLRVEDEEALESIIVCRNALELLVVLVNYAQNGFDLVSASLTNAGKRLWGGKGEKGGGVLLLCFGCGSQ